MKKKTKNIEMYEALRALVLEANPALKLPSSSPLKIAYVKPKILNNGKQN